MTFATMTLLADAESGPAVLRLLGRMHPAVVHFPIALLTVAAMLEAWRIVRRKAGVSPATPVCVVLGMVSALVATVFGLFLEEYEGGGKGGDLVELHKWIGIGATLAAILAAILLISPKTLTPLRGVLFVTAALVGATGYLGGDLVFGKNHLLKGIFDTPVARVPGNQAIAAEVPTGPPEFGRDVMPILAENCLRCHGGDKVKGKFDLKTKAAAFAGGRDGSGIVPGDPDKSKLFLSLVDKDPEAKMPPPKEKQLTEKQIETIRKWIAAGANWPDGVELK